MKTQRELFYEIEAYFNGLPAPMTDAEHTWSSACENGAQTCQLASRLYAIAIDGLREANRNSPFITKADAMRFINGAARIAAR
jgi:hypothetical protein